MRNWIKQNSKEILCAKSPVSAIPDTIQSPAGPWQILFQAQFPLPQCQITWSRESRDVEEHNPLKCFGKKHRNLGENAKNNQEFLTRHCWKMYIIQGACAGKSPS